MEKCPGRGIFHPEGGCPEWCDGEPLSHSTNGGPKEDHIFRGCQRLLFRPLMRGVTVAVDEQAASMDQARNQLGRVAEKTFIAIENGLVKSMALKAGDGG